MFIPAISGGLHLGRRQNCSSALATALTSFQAPFWSYPFGPDWEVFKVRDKVFMLMTDVTGEPIVILKTDPEDSKALQRAAR